MDKKLLLFLIILIIVGLFIIYFLLSNKQSNTINKYIFFNGKIANIGGCESTRYGCCYDGKTTKLDANGSNCFPKHRSHSIGGCGN